MPVNSFASWYHDQAERDQFVKYEGWEIVEESFRWLQETIPDPSRRKQLFQLMQNEPFRSVQFIEACDETSVSIGNCY
jgi:hypothetical protein